MECDIIALAEDFIIIIDNIDVTRQADCILNAQVRVAAIYIHAEIMGSIGNQHANGAETNDTKLFSADFCAGKSFFRFFRRLGNRGIPFIFLNPARAASQIAGCHQKTGND